MFGLKTASFPMFKKDSQRTTRVALRSIGAGIGIGSPNGAVKDSGVKLHGADRSIRHSHYQIPNSKFDR